MVQNGTGHYLTGSGQMGFSVTTRFDSDQETLQSGILRGIPIKASNLRRTATSCAANRATGNSTDYSNTDVNTDDGRFLMIQEPQESTPLGIDVVLNWFEELKRLAPTGKD